MSLEDLLSQWNSRDQELLRCGSVLDWRFRVAEASSLELGHRSRALVEQVRSTVKMDEIEALERNVAIAVEKNKLFTNKRPAEFIRRSAASLPLGE